MNPTDLRPVAELQQGCDQVDHYRREQLVDVVQRGSEISPMKNPKFKVAANRTKKPKMTFSRFVTPPRVRHRRVPQQSTHTARNICPPGRTSRRVSGALVGLIALPPTGRRGGTASVGGRVAPCGSPGPTRLPSSATGWPVEPSDAPVLAKGLGRPGSG
jgi:hypothetical protein